MSTEFRKIKKNPPNNWTQYQNSTDKATLRRKKDKKEKAEIPEIALQYRNFILASNPLMKQHSERENK
jgi:hypothetical protein